MARFVYRLLLPAFLFFALSCGSESGNEGAVATQRAALSAGDLRILGCEDAADWSSSAPLANSEVRVQGAASLQVMVPWHAEVSATLAGPVGGSPENFALSMRLSEPAGGEVRVVLVAPSAGLHWADLGGISLAGRAAGQWHRLEFPLGSFASQVASATELQLRVTVSGPNGPVLLDAMSFEGADPGGGGSGGTGGGAGGGSGGSAPSSALVLRFPAGTSFEEVIFGTQGGDLQVDDRALLFEGLSSTVFAPASQLGPSARTELGVESETGHLWVEGDVWARTGARVRGSIHSGGSYDAQIDVTVEGFIREGWDHQPFSEVSIPYEFPLESPPPVTVTNGQTLALAPGAYGPLTVQAQSTVQLSAGTYYLDDFVLNAGCTLAVDNAEGSVLVFVRGGFVRHGVIEYTAPELFNVLYGITGAGPVAMGNRSFRGVVVAPEADVELFPAAQAGASWFFGSVYARSVRAHENTRYHRFGFRRTDCSTLTDCSSAFGCSPSDCDGSCVEHPDAPGCVPNHCTNGVRDGNETGVDCGGSCPPCPTGGGCNSNADCGPDLECGENNGACYGQARAERVCWPVSCRVTNPERECGEAESLCGHNCACANPCSLDDPESSCPVGEVCKADMGGVLSTGTRDACVDPQCPSGDQALCGTATSLCGDHCSCTPDCASATCQNPADGCGGVCPGVCGPGDPGCTDDIQCPAGFACIADSSGATTCRPGECVFRHLSPPLCGSAGAPCGACPTCEAQCDGRACGLDPICGQDCGSCPSGSMCSAGQCVSVTADPPILGPDGAPIPDLPTPPTSTVGAVAGGFSVTEQGTSQYTIPIEVPPGRAGMEPALSLVYHGTKADGDAGRGWQLEGLSKITRCPNVAALDGYSKPVEGNSTDKFCLDGKRLESISGSYGGHGAEYRTLIDSFAKIISYQDSGEGDQHPFFAHVGRVARAHQGPDHFRVWTKDGRILEYGRTPDSLVKGRSGVRHTWLLNKVEDRAGNTILVEYKNEYVHLPTVLDDIVPTIVHPSVISYTGHGNTPGRRQVRFTYGDRTDPQVHFLQGSVPYLMSHRLDRITTYVDEAPVKNYRLEYVPGDISQVSKIVECAGGNDTHCKPPTEFEYVEESGFHHRPGGSSLAAAGQLDVNGDGRPDFFTTQVTDQGRDASTGLAIAQVSTDIVIGVGSNFLPLGVGIAVSVVWEVAKGPFWGAFRKAPDYEVSHTLRIGQEHVEGVDAPFRIYTLQGGIRTCGPSGSTVLLDYNQDGLDDVMTVCTSTTGHRSFYVSLSDGEGQFTPFPDASTPVMTVATNQNVFAPPPPVYDVDGDGLQDIVACTNDSTLQVWRRLGPDQGFSQTPLVLRGEFVSTPIPRWEPLPFCGPSGPYHVFDIDGDGTPNLVVRNGHEYSFVTGSQQHWAVLRYFLDGTGEPHLAFQDMVFPDVGPSTSGKGLSLSDINGDGLPDVWLAEDHNDAITWLNAGRGRFVSRSLARSGLPNSRHLRTAAIDYNADGRIDLVENWQPSSGYENVVRFPNGLLSSLVTAPASDILGPSSNPNLWVPGTFQLAADIDGDGNLDLFGGRGSIYYGRGARNTLLRRVVDGLGNFVRVSYESSAYEADERCDGSSWPERCLKRMTGLVSQHVEGFIAGGTEVSERTYTYSYKNARVNVAGHGWLGFEERSVGVSAGGVGTTTRLEYGAPERYDLDGNPNPTADRYLYPLVGMPTAVTVTQSSITAEPSPLEEEVWFRKTRVENSWEVVMSEFGRPFPRKRNWTTREYQLGATEVGLDGALPAEERLQNICSGFSNTDAYGNVTLHAEFCQYASETPATVHEVVSQFSPNPGPWLVSNPVTVSVTDITQGGGFQTQSWGYSYDSRGLVESV